jgi:hypothetical protein
VLVGRIGCRNRQAARGPRRPGVNSLWCGFGSSPRTRERQGAKKCRKPGSWWQSHETGGGFPPERANVRLRGVKTSRYPAFRYGGKTDRAKAGPGSTCRWKTLCTVDVAPIDEGATESALVLRYSGILRGLKLAEVRQRASEVGRQPGTRLTTPWPSSPAHAVLCASRSRGVRWSTRPKLDLRRQSRVHLRLGHRQTWLGAAAVSRFRLG